MQSLAVPSTISSWMNSSSVAKTWETRRPPRVVSSKGLVPAPEADTMSTQQGVQKKKRCPLD